MTFQKLSYLFIKNKQWSSCWLCEEVQFVVCHCQQQMPKRCFWQKNMDVKTAHIPLLTNLTPSEAHSMLNITLDWLMLCFMVQNVLFLWYMVTVYMELSEHIPTMCLQECMTTGSHWVCYSSSLNPLCLVILFVQESLGFIPLHARWESGDIFVLKYGFHKISAWSVER